MKVMAVIPAAGRGERMGGELPKQFRTLKDRPVLAYTLLAFERCPDIDGIVVVVPKDYVDFCSVRVVEPYGIRKVRRIVPGGRHRQDSVYEGLKAAEEAVIVVVHDGVRPLVRPKLISRSVALCRERGAAVVAVPLKETVKLVEGGAVQKTLPREALWAAQTPQTFRREVLWEAFQRALRDCFYATDEAALVERIGYGVWVVEGEYRNLKITTAEDLYLAEKLLEDECSG